MKIDHIARAQLLESIEALAGARSVDAIVQVLRRYARDIAGADGISVILREGEFCHYAAEDAISPLWAGQRLPAANCVSGWAMVNRQTVIIPDIYADERVPHDLYRSTFVRSMLMVPVGSPDVTAAIGAYWAEQITPHAVTINRLETLARSAAIALENARLLDALRVSERRFEGITDSIDQMIWSTRPDGFHDYYNKRWYDYTGMPPGSTDGEEWSGMFHPDDQDRAWARWQHSLATGDLYEIEYRLRHRSGDYRWVLGRAWPVRDDRGAISRWYGTCTDIHELRTAQDDLRQLNASLESRVDDRTAALQREIDERDRLEDTLRQMQRLEAVGQLTSGVAHDFNNLLTVILGNLEFLQRDAGQTADPKFGRRIANMKQAAERGAKLTAQLLAFSRRQRLEAKPIDLNDSVSSMQDLLRSSMGGSVQLELVLHPQLWPALVDQTQLELVILNLAINARDAMQVGGSLAIETSNAIVGTPQRPEEPAAGEYVVVSVADTGTGMSDSVLARAFEPFFTTKEVGKGSGLGLAQVYGFAKQSGGGVRIETRVGEGTVVKVYLPRVLEASPATTQLDDVAVAAMVPGSKRVLVIDDDSAVREITVSLLEQMGCNVADAGSGGAGLDLLARSDAAFDLVVLDFAMPGMNGADVARAIAKDFPDLPVLFVTGYADLTALREVGEDRIAQKPFDHAEFATKVKRLLGVDAGSSNVVALRR
ncbi:MAG: response regulator [Tardiphaga sp.]|jgi:PAS domain S-box-containing protein